MSDTEAARLHEQNTRLRTTVADLVIATNGLIGAYQNAQRQLKQPAGGDSFLVRANAAVTKASRLLDDLTVSEP